MTADYGTSWKSCPIEFLWDKKREEEKELKTAQREGNIVKIRKELIDNSNLNMMLWDRLRDLK